MMSLVHHESERVSIETPTNIICLAIKSRASIVSVESCPVSNATHSACLSLYPVSKKKVEKKDNG